MWHTITPDMLREAAARIEDNENAYMCTALRDVLELHGIEFAERVVEDEFHPFLRRDGTIIDGSWQGDRVGYLRKLAYEWEVA